MIRRGATRCGAARLSSLSRTGPGHVTPDQQLLAPTNQVAAELRLLLNSGSSRGSSEDHSSASAASASAAFILETTSPRSARDAQPPPRAASAAVFLLRFFWGMMWAMGRAAGACVALPGHPRRHPQTTFVELLLAFASKKSRPKHPRLPRIADFSNPQSGQKRAFCCFCQIWSAFFPGSTL